MSVFELTPPLKCCKNGVLHIGGQILNFHKISKKKKKKGQGRPMFPCYFFSLIADIKIVSFSVFL